MRCLRIGGMDKRAGDGATPLLGESSAGLTDRRDMLMRVGALAIGALAFVATAQATVADDDDGGGGYYDDDGGGYYHDVWGGGHYGDDDWRGGYHDDDDWGGDDD
jgi:hypothetical protein